MTELLPINWKNCPTQADVEIVITIKCVDTILAISTLVISVLKFPFCQHHNLLEVINHLILKSLYIDLAVVFCVFSSSEL